MASARRWRRPCARPRHSSSVVRRFWQSVLCSASARGTWVPQIAQDLSCSPQTVRNAIHAFNARGLEALQPGSSRPHTTHPAFDATGLERLAELLHQSPRDDGKAASLWTLTLAAEVSAA